VKGLFWRLVLGKYASLQELKECWTLAEVIDFNILLDAKETIENLHMQAKRHKK
jgi:hypothetical protein